MATLNDIRILLDLDAVTKVTCTMIDCRYNLMNADYSGDRGAYCSLKYIAIGQPDARCTKYSPLAAENYEETLDNDYVVPYKKDDPDAEEWDQ